MRLEIADFEITEKSCQSGSGRDGSLMLLVGSGRVKPMFKSDLAAETSGERKMVCVCFRRPSSTERQTESDRRVIKSSPA